jgi:hypothetical protein
MGFVTRRVERGVRRGAFGCLGCPLMLLGDSAIIVSFGWWLVQVVR